MGKRVFCFADFWMFLVGCKATKQTKCDTSGRNYGKQIQPIVDLVGTGYVWMSYGGDLVGASDVLRQKISAILDFQ